MYRIDDYIYKFCEKIEYFSQKGNIKKNLRQKSTIEKQINMRIDVTLTFSRTSLSVRSNR